MTDIVYIILMYNILRVVDFFYTKAELFLERIEKFYIFASLL